MQIREYQEKALSELFSWWDTHSGNPCVVMPTGSGKSIVIAAFIQRAISIYPQTRILMCTHQKELIEQDYEKLKLLYPEADIGIYSAGIGKRDCTSQITFASIQSIYKKATKLGTIHLMLIDEAHLINHADHGMYRTLINKLKIKNPALKCIGFTATPYRMSHGMITQQPALFNAPLIEPVSIKDLQEQGFLCKLTSKATEEVLDTKGVKIVAGDFAKKQLVEAVDIPGKNEAVVNEVIKRAVGRKSWLFFCAGIKHAEHIKDLLTEKGIVAECVTGQTSKEERERILEDYKSGKIQAVTNANVLTTGFDYPGIDLIVLLRPTLSPGLYMQEVGRGLRIAENKENCLVLDFVENVLRHGPITNVQPPSGRLSTKTGVAPGKICPDCREIVALSRKICPECGHEFPSPDPVDRDFQLSQQDINGENNEIFEEISHWRWDISTSKAGNKMIVITYYPKNYTAKPIKDYFLCWHDNSFVKEKAQKRISKLYEKAKPDSYDYAFINAEKKCQEINFNSNIPKSIAYHIENRYPKVDKVFWN